MTKLENIKGRLDKFTSEKTIGLSPSRGTYRLDVGWLIDELEGIRNSEKFVLSEDCPSDEKHCGCVPILKSEVKRLGADLDDWKTIARNRAIGWAKENKKVIELKGQ